MPAFGDQVEVEKIKEVCISRGAKGFKHKGVNYWDESALLRGEVISKGGREDTTFDSVILKSGEPFTENGQVKSGVFRIPYSNWKAYKTLDRTFEDYGYSDINKFDWGYCK